MISSVFGAEDINRQIPFHGELADEKGKPLDGTFDISFAIYDAPSGGTELWRGAYTEANGNPVSVEDGEFRVMLGSGVGNEFDSELFFNDTHYLSITVESDNEMTPRERLGASAYAFNADSVDGLGAEDFLQQDTEIVLGLSSDNAILTLTQQGAGDLMSLYNGSDELLFSVLNSGRVTAHSFESYSADTNTFNGPLSIVSGDASSFAGDILLSDGAKLRLGNGDGVGLYQDISILGPSGLMFLPEGSALLEGYVHLLTPETLLISSNTNSDRTGTHEPSIELGSNGTVSISNTSQGDPGNKFIELDFTDGVKIPQGFVKIGAGDAVVELDVDGTIRSSELSGGPFALESDVDGNIIANPSDERLKQNIRPIMNALDMMLSLRGVKYEWKDTGRFGNQTEVGFVAQEVQEVLPEVVRDSGEYLSLNTKNIVAVVVEAVKELHTKVEEYFTRTERLEREVDMLRGEIEAMKGGEKRSESSENRGSELHAETPLVENVENAEEESIAAPEEAFIEQNTVSEVIEEASL
jgi:hypothetical protein